MRQKLGNCQGVAQQTASQIGAGLGGTLRRLASAAEGVSFAMREIIGATFGPVIESASGLCRMIKELISVNDGLLKGRLATSGTFAGFGAAMKILAMAGSGCKAIFPPCKTAAVQASGAGKAAAADASAKAENLLTNAKSTARRKDMARGVLISKLMAKQGLSIAFHQKEAAVIMAASIKSIVAAKAGAGASALKTAGYFAATAAAAAAITGGYDRNRRASRYDGVSY